MSIANNKIDRISSYFKHLRKDVISAIPPTAKYVLSVGCASGVTEAELVKKGMKVVGVELNLKAARIARQRGLIVLEGDASEIDVSIADELYDCIIYADVLEHLPDPLNVLRRHVKYLQSNGTVIVSVPNFRHYLIFWKLFIRGQVKYGDAGILDRTHLRITTRKMVLEWFDKVGLVPVSCKYQIFGRRNKLLSACLFGLANEFIAFEILCVGKKL